MNKVVDRLSEGGGVGKTVLARIKNELDIKDWKHEDGKKDLCGKPFGIADSYVSVVSMVIRIISVEQIKLLTIEALYEKLIKLNYADV